MHQAGRWSVMAETTNGRTFSSGGEEHCRWIMKVHELRPVSGRVEVLGSVLVDPDGQVVEAHGVEVCIDGSRPALFETLRHLGHDEWVDCVECGRVVSMGQMVSTSGRCSSCTYARDPFPRSVTYDEAESLPRPGKCMRCGRKNAKRWFAVPKQWVCLDCAWMVRETSAADWAVG